MVARVLVAVAMTTAVLSSAALCASPLHELQATTGPSHVCGNVVVHANAAIDATLLADAAIGRALTTLRTVDFDAPGSARKSALADIATAANEIRRNAERSKSETLRLRGFAAEPAGDDRKADLDILTSGLDATAERDRDVARTIDGFAAGVAYRALNAANAANAGRSLAFASIGSDDIASLHGNLAAPSSLSAATPAPPGDTYAARAAASEIAAKITDIDADEARAAAHSESAIGGC